MSKKAITLLGWFLIPIGIIFSCVLSYSLTEFLSSTTFTFWKSLGSPQSEVAKIVGADSSNILVEAKNGKLFMLTVLCDNNEFCKKWVKVDSTDGIDTSRFTTLTWSESCVEFTKGNLSKSPKGSTTKCLLASYYGPEYNIETYYALMEDGSIQYWHHDYGGISGVIIFGILFISFTSIIILIFNNIHKKVIVEQKAG